MHGVAIQGVCRMWRLMWQMQELSCEGACQRVIWSWQSSTLRENKWRIPTSFSRSYKKMELLGRFSRLMGEQGPCIQSTKIVCFSTPHSAQIATTCPLLRLLALTTTHTLFAWGVLCCLMRPLKLSSGSSSNGCWQWITSIHWTLWLIKTRQWLQPSQWCSRRQHTDVASGTSSGLHGQN